MLLGSIVIRSVAWTLPNEISKAVWTVLQIAVD